MKKSFIRTYAKLDELYLLDRQKDHAYTLASMVLLF